MRIPIAAAALLMAAFGGVGAAVHAQSPVPTPPVIPTIEIYPFRIVVSGPANASPGDAITYAVSFEQVSGEFAGPTREQVAFNFVYSPTDALEFVSVATPPGGSCEPSNPPPQPPDYLRCGGGTGSGEFTFAMRVRDSFVGDAVVGVQLLGTGLQLPEGSQAGVTTHVAGSAPPTGSPTTAPTPQVGLPQTGQLGGRTPGVMLVVATVLGLGAAVPVVVGLRLRRGRFER